MSGTLERETVRTCLDRGDIARATDATASMDADDPARLRALADALVATTGGSRDLLEAIRRRYQTRLHAASDDFAATQGLRVVELALSRVSPTCGPSDGPRRRTKARRRRWPRRRAGQAAARSPPEPEGRLCLTKSSKTPSPRSWSATQVSWRATNDCQTFGRVSAPCSQSTRSCVRTGSSNRSWLESTASVPPTEEYAAPGDYAAGAHIAPFLPATRAMRAFKV
jgi:hypothetical protein